MGRPARRARRRRDRRGRRRRRGARLRRDEPAPARRRPRPRDDARRAAGQGRVGGRRRRRPPANRSTPRSAAERRGVHARRGGLGQRRRARPGSDAAMSTAALAASDVVVEGRFSTSWVHQGYIEPQVAMAELDRDGVLHLTSATQGTFWTRSELSRLFGLPIARRPRDRARRSVAGSAASCSSPIRWRLRRRSCSAARSASSSRASRTSGWPTRRRRRSSR